MRKLAIAFIISLLVLAPLKFGGLWSAGAIAVFPLDVWEWLFAAWPPPLMPTLCGLGLLLVLYAYRAAAPGQQLEEDLSSVSPQTTLVLLLLATMPGLINTTAWYEAQLFLWHLTGAAAIAFAINIMLRAEPVHTRTWLTSTVAVVGLWVAFQGWRQVPGGGLEETLKLAQEMTARNAAELPRAMAARLEGGRAFGSFFLPNSYAAHLILTGPLLFVCSIFATSSLTRNLEKHPKLQLKSSAAFKIVGCVAIAFLASVWGGALFFSKSRAALVVAIMTFTCAGGLILPGRKKKIAALGICLIAGCAFFSSVQHGRSFSSLSARFDYWRAAQQMTLESPVVGKGIYEFFPYYMRYKTADSEETRLPHNAVLNFASQSGILAGLVYLLFGFCGLRNLIRVVRTNGLNPRQRLLSGACALGFLAWWGHSLLDLNIHIPGSLTTACVMLVLSTPVDDESNRKKNKKGGTHKLILILTLTAFAIFAVIGIWRLPAEATYRRMTELPIATATLQPLCRLAESASQYDPFNPYPYEYLAKTAARLGKFQLAAIAYERALNRSPHRAAWWFHLARCRQALGEQQKAKRAMAKARYWYPANPQYRFRIVAP